MTKFGQTVVDEAVSQRSMPNKQIDKHANLGILNVIGIFTILVTALHFSAHCGNLYLKELTPACSIIGLALIIKSLGKPPA